MDSIASIAKPNVNVPIRRAEIFQLASKMRKSCGSQPIDIVAEYYGIVLVRMAGPVGRDAGFAYIEFTRRPKYVESLSHPEEQVRIWGAWTREPVRSIVINTNSGIPEREVFWHELYHLFYSPHAVQRSERFEHRFSTEGALHTQEERRANEFAAAILVPALGGCRTAAEVAERFQVSERLAGYAIQLYSALGSGIGGAVN